MITHYKRGIIGVAAVSALSMGIASNAHAEAYALGYGNFLNGTVSIAGSLITPQNPNGTYSIDSVANTSRSSADLNALHGGGTVTENSVSGGALTGNPLPDAPVACLGTAVPCTNNAFTAIGHNGSSYSVGDGQFISDQFQNPGVSTIHVENIAESDVIGKDQAGAIGGNSSKSQMSVVLNQSSSVGFAFTADPYLSVYMNSTGQSAEADIAFSITIQDASGNTVFNWAPNGGIAAGIGENIFGGSATIDDASLNTSRSLLSAGSAIYDPTGLGTNFGTTTGGSCGGTGGLCDYAASTGTLSSGTYTITIAESKTTAVKNIPEPQTVALMGLGLVLMGFLGVSSRRRTTI